MPQQQEEVLDFESRITDVWSYNLEDAMEEIRQLVDTYPYVSMDTEFPGIVARPVGSFRTSTEYQYQTLRCNVNLLKIIQLGLTFADEEGKLPPGICTWQFNFKFNLNEDMYAQDSIELLTKSGIDFKRHEEEGIDVEYFAEQIMSSGIVLNDDVRWISFHSGYDFGYLVKLVTNQVLPTSESEFFELLHTYFPCIYDIKYLMKSCENLKGGLNQLAQDLDVKRIGPAHQAGSDSLLTSAAFFRMVRLFFENNLDDSKYMGVLYGLGEGAVNTMHSSPPAKYPNTKFAGTTGVVGATTTNGVVGVGGVATGVVQNGAGGGGGTTSNGKTSPLTIGYT